MIRLPPKSTLTDPLFPSTTRFRSHHDPDEREQRGRLRVGIPRGDQLCPDGTIVAVGKGDPALLDLLDQAGPEVLDFGRAQRTCGCQPLSHRSEEHTSELQSLMRTSYAVFCLKKKKYTYQTQK